MFRADLFRGLTGSIQRSLSRRSLSEVGRLGLRVGFEIASSIVSQKYFINIKEINKYRKSKLVIPVKTGIQ